jgi:hypothetical protein
MFSGLAYSLCLAKWNVGHKIHPSAHQPARILSLTLQHYSRYCGVHGHNHDYYQSRRGIFYMTSFWLATTYYLDAGWPRNPSAIEMQHGADGQFQTYGLCESVSLSATRRLALRTVRTASRTWIREGSSFSSRNYLGRPSILISRLGFTREN